MLKRSGFLILILATLVAAATLTSTAQSPDPAASGSSFDLLDRGSPSVLQGPKPKTHTGLMTGTLANMMGTPGVTIGMIMTAAPAAPVGVFHGYFFAPVIDFPASYQPFFVTGAYVWVAPPIFASPIVGAGVAPGPFTSATGTWAGFTAVPVPAGVFSPGMIFGGKSIFAHSPAIVAPPGFGVACGFDPAVAGAVLGGLTPGTGGGKPVSMFIPPGMGSGLGPIAAPPATYVAGCFISGATVPVELQSFHID